MRRSRSRRKSWAVLVQRFNGEPGDLCTRSWQLVVGDRYGNGMGRRVAVKDELAVGTTLLRVDER